jgi:hypothetical protein
MVSSTSSNQSISSPYNILQPQPARPCKCHGFFASSTWSLAMLDLIIVIAVFLDK